jgi:hypothetical protein
MIVMQWADGNPLHDVIWVEGARLFPYSTPPTAWGWPGPCRVGTKGSTPCMNAAQLHGSRIAYQG